MTRLFAIILTIIFISCENVDKYKNTEEITFFKRNNFMASSALNGEIIDFDAGLSPRKFFVVKDTLIFVENYYPTPYYYDVFGLKSKDHIMSFAKKGKGPYEYLSCGFIYKSNDLGIFSIRDGSAKTITTFHIDSLVALREKYTPRRSVLPGVVKDYTVLKKDTILGYNHYFFDNGNIRNRANPVLKISLDSPETDDIYIKDSKYFAFNVSGAYVLNIPKSNSIILAHHYEDKIEIYDKDMKIVERMRGPDLIQPEYIIHDSDISQKDDTYYRAYYSAFRGKDSLYLLYAGFNGASYDEPIGRPLELFKIGFDGELLHRYQLDRFISYITLDSNEEYLYGTDLVYANSKMEHQLVRYKL